MYWNAARPSVLPTAKPGFADALKHDTTRVCSFNGDATDWGSRQLGNEGTANMETLYTVVGLARLYT
jgi:hypothetical protein